MKFEFENRLESLEEALDALEAHVEEVGGSPKLSFTARLDLEELSTNIIKYGYDDSETHIVHADFAMGQPPSMVLEDDGHPFDPTTDAPEPDTSLNVEDRPIGGLGLHMVRSMTASFTYRRAGTLNRVTVTFPT